MSYHKLRLTTDHVELFEPHADHQFQEFDNNLIQYGPHCYAGFWNDELIFMGGFVKDDPCWQFWGVYSEAFKPIHARHIMRECRREFKQVPCDRAHHLVYMDDVTGHMLAKFMGAELEGVMKKYYNGLDYAIYAMVK